jgi:hypothetical protein
VTGPVWYSTVRVTFLPGDVELIDTVSGLAEAGSGTVTDAAQKESDGRAGAVVEVVLLAAVDVLVEAAVVGAEETRGWPVVVVVARGRVLDVVVVRPGLVVAVVVVDPGDNVEPLELKAVVDDDVVVLPMDTRTAPFEPTVVATNDSAATATTRTAAAIRADSGHVLSAAISRDMCSYLPGSPATRHGPTEPTLQSSPKPYSLPQCIFLPHLTGRLRGCRPPLMGSCRIEHDPTRH